MEAENLFSNFDWSNILNNWGDVQQQLDNGQIPYEEDITWDVSQRPASEQIAFAKANGMTVTGNAQIVSWGIPDSVYTGMENGTYTADQLNNIMEFMIKARIIKYKDPVIGRWTVHSEIIEGINGWNDSPNNGQASKTLYSTLGGYHFVVNTLKWAHEADPNAKLSLVQNCEPDVNNSVFQTEDTQFWQMLSYIASQLQADGSIPLNQVEIISENNFWIYAPPTKDQMVTFNTNVQSLGFSVGPSQTIIVQSNTSIFSRPACNNR